MKENKLSPPPRHLKPGTARSSPPPEWNVPGGLCRVADLGTAARGFSLLMGRPLQDQMRKQGDTVGLRG